MERPMDRLEEVIGLLAKLASGVKDAAKSVVFGSEKVKRDKLVKLHNRRAELAHKLRLVKLAQREKRASEKDLKDKAASPTKKITPKKVVK